MLEEFAASLVVSQPLAVPSCLLLLSGGSFAGGHLFSGGCFDDGLTYPGARARSATHYANSGGTRRGGRDVLQQHSPR